MQLREDWRLFQERRQARLHERKWGMLIQGMITCPMLTFPRNLHWRRWPNSPVTTPPSLASQAAKLPKGKSPDSLGRKIPLTRRFGGPSTRRFSRCHANQNLRVNLRVELVGHKTSLIVRVWLRVHTEVYTEVKQLGPGGRREFDVSIFETTFETSVWSR